MTKIYNPLLLDTNKDTPTYEGDKAKWWLVHVSPNKAYCLYRVLSKKNKECDYVVVNNKTSDIEYISKSLEDCGTHIQMFMAFR